MATITSEHEALVSDLRFLFLRGATIRGLIDFARPRILQLAHVERRTIFMCAFNLSPVFAHWVSDEIEEPDASTRVDSEVLLVPEILSQIGVWGDSCDPALISESWLSDLEMPEMSSTFESTRNDRAGLSPEAWARLSDEDRSSAVSSEASQVLNGQAMRILGALLLRIDELRPNAS
jgi:hypothetical protein